MRRAVAEYLSKFEPIDQTLAIAQETSPTGLWDVTFTSPEGMAFPWRAVLPGENRADAWLLGEQVQRILQDREAELTGKPHLTSIVGVNAEPHEETK